MKKLDILYRSFWDFDNSKFTIGGIQTYLANLIKVAKNLNYDVELFQMGKANRSIVMDFYKITEINTADKGYKYFCKTVSKQINSDDLVLYASDDMIPFHNPFKHSIAIQHGITWDIPNDRNRNLLVSCLFKAIRNYLQIRRIRSVEQVVCVDYNFVNWYRAEVDQVGAKLTVIPNFTDIAAEYSKDNQEVNIIFARRLWWYRGTRVFMEAISRILNEYKNVKVTVAGDGPDLSLLHKNLDKFSNVRFITYTNSESLDMHKDMHIAIVPTVGSEGTSLSLLEAMSAQCAVIASNVGGMTNIILDGYNGLLVDSNSPEELYDAISKLLKDNDFMQRLAANGYITVKESFSLSVWSKKWEKVLKSYL